MKRYLGTSWRTTLAGIASIIAAVTLFLHSSDPDAKVAAGALVAAGLTLIKAEDPRPS